MRKNAPLLPVAIFVDQWQLYNPHAACHGDQNILGSVMGIWNLRNTQVLEKATPNLSSRLRSRQTVLWSCYLSGILSAFDQERRIAVVRGEWLRKPSRKTTVVFIHGIRSSGETCWQHKNGSYWPELLKCEESFKELGIYVYSYETGIFSGSYSLNDVVDDLKERLFNLDKVAECRKIIFVCHSMGGIVVRKFLVERAYDLLDRKIEVGLFLIASPSLGSEYANWFSLLAKALGNTQADALRFSQNNIWLNGLDKEFLNLKESGRIKLFGKELVEDKFVVLQKLIWIKQVVPPFSGARYFGEPWKVPGSDHSSIAKPEHAQADQHRALLSFLEMNSGDDLTDLIPDGLTKSFIDFIPKELVNRTIEEDVEKLRKARFYSEFDSIGSSLRLGNRIADGDLSSGSIESRGRALAWCARFLSRSDKLEFAERFIKLAKTLGDFVECTIAEACILSQKGDKEAALKTVSSIDSDTSHSASLMIVTHHDGTNGALNWIKVAGYTAKDLDSDGKSSLLSHQLQLEHWEEARQTVRALSSEDFARSPVLHRLAALATLIPAVPQAFRTIALTQPPIEARETQFPLASDADAMDARRAAAQHFLDAVEAENKLACPQAAKIDDQYALWLELRDPAQSEHGKKRLEDKLRDPKTALSFVHYALQFGIKLDLDAVERDIERNIAINGGMTVDAAMARFALVFTQPNPEQAASYIARYQDQLTAHIDANWMCKLQIDFLSQAGLISRANEILDWMIKKAISSKEEIEELKWIISQAKTGDLIESIKARYERTRHLSDLINLVIELESHERWDDLGEYGRRLFEETHSLSDAERLVNAFNNSYRSETVVGFLKVHADLLSQSSHLRMSYAWGLYHEGLLIESRAALTELGDEVDSPNYRALQVNLGIATGDWASLSVYIDKEYRSRGNRTAHDLIAAAQLALHLGLPQAKDLLFQAAAKANDDPAILVASYFISSSAGWEDDPQVFQWIEKAAELSGDDGPIRRMSLKDILDQKPEWDRRASETWRLLAQGQIPIFLAAQLLNRTLIGLSTFPALANLTETDPRRKSAISAYSGKRVASEFDVSGKTVAFDSTALLTLSFLNILDAALDAFETIYIPHSTLGWLFRERQKAAFHQPSRIANARKVLDLMAKGLLEKFIPSTVASSELSTQVGDELAALIAEAEKVRYGDNSQHIVIRSAPVHRISSLMEEEADLSSHGAVLSSCFAVVEKLRKKGQLTASEEKHAQTYLHLHEKSWPNQPEISDGATLYLDDLAVSYLLHIGVLGKLKAAGLKGIVSPVELSEADELISYERISDEVKYVIERIRAALNQRIESGHIKVSRSQRKFEDPDDKNISEDPTFAIIAISPFCDAVIVDDRFLNQHVNVENDGKLTPVLNTFDLLDSLVFSGFLSNNDRVEYRTRLRRAGYFFIPVSEDELELCLMGSNVSYGIVVETAELKAIRESILRVRMSDWLQLPEEAPWLNGIMETFVRVIRNLWATEADIEDIAARSNWLVEQIDFRGWVHCLIPENAGAFVRIGQAAGILSLLLPLTGVQQSVLDAYWGWVEQKILFPIQEQFSDAYQWVVDWFRGRIADVVKIELSKSERLKTDFAYDRAAIVLAALKFIPPLMRKCLLENQGFREEYGLKTDARITFGANDSTFQRSAIFNVVRAAHAGKGTAELNDAENRKWNLSIDDCEGEYPNIVLSSNQQRMVLPDFSVLSENITTRIRFLEKSAADANLPLSAEEKWRSILTERALEDDEVDTFLNDLRDTPVHLERNIRNNIMTGKSSISTLVPNSRRYFERLVGTYDGSSSIRDYAAGTGRAFLGHLLAWRPYEGFLFSLLLSSHPAMTVEIDPNHIGQDDLEKAFDYLEKHGDMLSRLGAFEVGLRILSDRPEVEPFLQRFVHRIRDDDVDGSASEFKLFSALFVLIDGELARTCLLAVEPPFYRRLASLAQAALIHRQLIQCGVDYEYFSKWAFSIRGQYFYMQSLADMRTEPRWSPDLADPPQLQADFFGRIMIAGNNFRTNLGDGFLRDSIFGEGEQSLIKLCEFPRPYFPGPLEGAEDSPTNLPEDFARIINKQLGSNEVNAASFIALVNSAMIFKITSDHAELAAKALKLSNYTLANLDGKTQLMGILSGLATVAAVTRNPKLADEFRVLVRRYRRDHQYGFSVEEAMRMSLVASAAHKDLIEWSGFAGDCLTEFAFGELEENEGKVLHSHLSALLHLVPELWVSSSKADAALRAWLYS